MKTSKIGNLEAVLSARIYSVEGLRKKALRYPFPTERSISGRKKNGNDERRI